MKRCWPFEVAQHGVGKLAVHLDVLLIADGVPLVAGRAGVAEQPYEEVGQEVGQDFLLAKAIQPARGDQFGPMAELGRIDGRGFEPRQMRTQHVGTEQWLGFDGHGEPCLKTGILRGSAAECQQR